MFKISGEAEWLYWLVVGVAGSNNRQAFCRRNHVGVSPVSCSAARSNPCVGVEDACRQDRQSPPKQEVRFAAISGHESER
jgi:hypothetical protein